MIYALFPVLFAAVLRAADWPDGPPVEVHSPWKTIKVNAPWIWGNENGPANTWMCFRHDFSLDAVPAVVPVVMAADTHYWLWVNGTLAVEHGGLKRGPTPAGTYADHLDLAKYLRPGRNRIAALVWYLGISGSSHLDSGQGGFMLDAPLPDLRTSARWRLRIHPGFVKVPRQGLGVLSESPICFDARADLSGWMEAEPGEGWVAAVEKRLAPSPPWGDLAPRPIPFFRIVRREYENKWSLPCQGPAALTGQLPANLQVLPCFRVHAEPGKTIMMKAERAKFDTAYITREGEQSFEAPAWGNGHSVTYRIPEGVRVLSLDYREIGFDAEFQGSFMCSEPRLNVLWSKCARSMYVNMHDNYMDCPDRERSQWPGDMANTAAGAYYVFDRRVDSLFQKAMREFLAWQTEDGVLWGAVPSGRFVGKYREFPAQNLALIAVGLPHHIEQTDDQALARVAVPRIRRYLIEHWRMDPNGLPAPRKPNTAWGAGTGSWMDWGPKVDRELLETTWYAWGLAGLDYVRAFAGLPEDPELASRRQSIAQAFDGAFWDETVGAYRTRGYSEVPDVRGNALAVCAGLAPQSRQEPLATFIAKSDNCSIYMERYPVQALFVLERPQDGLRRLLRRYEADIKSSYSTLPEGFNGKSNHGWGSWPSATLVQQVAGIRPATPGYKTIHIHPRPAGLTQFAVRFPSIRGEIAAGWNETDSGATLAVECPPGATATVTVPSVREWKTIHAPGTTPDAKNPRRFTAGPGSWVFTME